MRTLTLFALCVFALGLKAQTLEGTTRIQIDEANPPSCQIVAQRLREGARRTDELNAYIASHPDSGIQDEQQRRQFHALLARALGPAFESQRSNVMVLMEWSFTYASAASRRAMFDQFEDIPKALKIEGLQWDSARSSLPETVQMEMTAEGQLRLKYQLTLSQYCLGNQQAQLDLKVLPKVTIHLHGSYGLAR